MSEPTVLRAMRLLAPDEVMPPVLATDSGRVVAVGDAALELGRPVEVAGTVTPGLVDLQVNGGAGVDLQSPGPDRGRLHGWLRSGGVLAYAPTLVSAQLERLAQLAPDLSGELNGVLAMAPHLEGPFISEARLGAHPPEPVRNCEAEAFCDLAERVASLVTLAPERPGALELIERLSSDGIRVSLGHSDATFEQAEAGLAAGATLVTHLFNAMSPLQRREPGLAGAALAGLHAPWTGVIADGVHVHPAVVMMAARLLGERLVLVSDSVAAAGVAEVPQRTAAGRLAGSIARLDVCVRNLIEWGIAPSIALRAATATPAAAAGLTDRGLLEPGRLGQVVLWTADWQVVAAGNAERVIGAGVPA